MGQKYQSSGITLEQQTSEDLLLIEGYGGGGFRLMGKKFEGGALVLPTGVFPIKPSDLSTVEPNDFDPIFNLDQWIELMLVGTGKTMQLLPKPIKEYLQERGLSFDIMDTGAAARTHNVLLMEGRQIATFLIPID